MPDIANQGRVIEAEIFSAGTWNGETFTRQDLEEIARNFTELRDVLKPPLKFGHDPGQNLLGQHDGDPALGWVAALRVEGDKLLATFAGVPELVFDAIREGRYRHVSAELYFDVRHEGRALGKALKAVALLGADLPAVTNLEELGAYLHGDRTAETLAGESRLFTLGVREGRILVDSFEAPGAQTELAELRAYKAREESRRAAELEQRRQAAFRSAREEAAALAERAVREGRLLPHLRDALLAEIDSQARSYSGRAPLAVSLDWVQDFLAEAGPLLPQGEVALAAGRDAAADEPEDPSRTLSRLATAKMAELGLSYGKAADYVLQTHPGLARAYRDYILNANAGG